MVKKVAVLVWQKLGQVHQTLEEILATFQEFNDLVVALRAEVARIAAVIQALVDRLAAGGMSAAEEDQVKSDLSAAVDSLKTLGA